MGVKDLWKLLEPAGRPVNIESLDGKVLAVDGVAGVYFRVGACVLRHKCGIQLKCVANAASDVSIWLNQALKGARDQSGAALPNSHLLVLFHRLCKLLYYNIKPVVVFDGATAELKHQTLVARRKRRHLAQAKSDMASKKLIWNYAKSKAMEEITGVTSSSSKSKSANIVGRSQFDDLYHLPPLSDDVLKELESQGEEELATTNKNELYQSYYEDLDQLDFDGDHFKSLPAEIQHELITARKQLDKNRSSVQPDALPINANEFSSYQLTRLVERSQLSKRLGDVRKSLSLAESSAMVGLDPSLCEVEVNRIASDETARYILIKNQPGGGLYTDSGIAQDRVLDTVGDRADSYSDTVDISNSNIVDTSIDRVDIDSDKVVTCGDYRTVLEGDSVSDITGEDTACTSSDRVANTANDIVSAHDDTVDDNVVYIDDDKPNLEKSHVNIITASSVKKTTICEIYDSKVNTDNDTISGEVDIIDYKESITCDKIGTGVIVTDDKVNTLCDKADVRCDRGNIPCDMRSDKMDILCDKADILCDRGDVPCDKVDMHSDKMNTLCDKAGILCDKVATLSDEVVTNDDTKVRTVVGNVDVNKADVMENRAIASQTKQTVDSAPNPPQHALEPNEACKQPEEAQVHILTAEGGTVSGEVELITSDSDSELEELAPLAKRVCSNGSSTRHELLDTVQRELESASPLELQGLWELERAQLQSEQARQSRLAATVSNQVYEEAQELLVLFGVPYIISPCEAEAQCAQLDYTGQVSGTVTDDSDYFLFGGKQAFRSFFSTSRDIDCYKEEVIQQTLGLDRLQLINLAYLLGSDYTVGVAGVGIVTAMEVLKDFHGCGLEVLQKFKIWHQTVPPGSLAKNKLRRLTLGNDFPDERVQQAYLHPSVDESREEFAWSVPDLDLLRQYTKEKFGWDKKRCDQELLPVIQKMNQRKEKQRKIKDYTIPRLGNGNPFIGSRRLLKAVSKIKQHNGIQDTATAPQARTELVLSCSESSDED